MNQSPDTPPDPTAMALIANITQLMDEVEEMLRASPNQPEEAKPGGHLSANKEPPTCATTFFSQARGKIAAGARHTEKIVRANPLRSLTMAVGAGALIGLMLARRHPAPA